MVEEQVRPIVVEGVAMTSPRWVPAPPLTALRTIPKGDETRARVLGHRGPRRPNVAAGQRLGSLDCEGHLTTAFGPATACGSWPRRAGRRRRSIRASSISPHYERSRRVWCRLRGRVSRERDRRRARQPLVAAALAEPGAAGRGGPLRRSINPHEPPTLASAMLLGTREQLDPERNEDFLVTGTIHVLSICGLHVGILACGLLGRSAHGPVAAAAGADRHDAAHDGLRLPDRSAAAGRAGDDAGRRALPGAARRPAGALASTRWRPPASSCSLLNPASLFLAGPQLSFLAVATMIVFHPC